MRLRYQKSSTLALTRGTPQKYPSTWSPPAATASLTRQGCIITKFLFTHFFLFKHLRSVHDYIVSLQMRRRQGESSTFLTHVWTNPSSGRLLTSVVNVKKTSKLPQGPQLLSTECLVCSAHQNVRPFLTLNSETVLMQFKEFSNIINRWLTGLSAEMEFLNNNFSQGVWAKT